MLRYLTLIGLFLCVHLSTAHASAIEVAEAVITTAVVEREPIDEVKVFPRENGRLYCFTRIVGAEEPTFVYHLWYRGEQLMSRVALPVNSSSWRTWSLKPVEEDEPGKWRVEIEDEGGSVLTKVDFELR